MRILIAEDSQVSRRMLEQQLTRLGHDVVAVADGAAAWEILQRPDSPELALLDWMMPGMETAYPDDRGATAGSAVAAGAGDLVQPFDTGSDDDQAGNGAPGAGRSAG